jgi:hypothetical protein
VLLCGGGAALAGLRSTSRRASPCRSTSSIPGASSTRARSRAEEPRSSRSTSSSASSPRPRRDGVRSRGRGRSRSCPRSSQEARVPRGPDLARRRGRARARLPRLRRRADVGTLADARARARALESDLKKASQTTTRRRSSRSRTRASRRRRRRSSRRKGTGEQLARTIALLEKSLPGRALDHADLDRPARRSGAPHPEGIGAPTVSIAARAREGTTALSTLRAAFIESLTKGLPPAPRCATGRARPGRGSRSTLTIFAPPEAPPAEPPEAPDGPASCEKGSPAGPEGRRPLTHGPQRVLAGEQALPRRHDVGGRRCSWPGRWSSTALPRRAARAPALLRLGGREAAHRVDVRRERARGGQKDNEELAKTVGIPDPGDRVPGARGVRLDPKAGAATNQYFAAVSRVREELLRLAGRGNLRLPDDLGLPALAPTREAEIERYLEALDLVDRAVRLALANGVQRIDKIEIRLDPKLASRQGVGELEKTRVEVSASGRPAPLVPLRLRVAAARKGFRPAPRREGGDPGFPAERRRGRSPDDVRGRARDGRPVRGDPA